MYKTIEDNGFYCISSDEREPTISCLSENDANNLCNILNDKNKIIKIITRYSMDLEDDMKDISMYISNLVQKQYDFRDSKRFYYDENKDFYKIIDTLGEFESPDMLNESETKYIVNFLNYLWFQKIDLDTQISHLEEDIAYLRGLPEIHKIQDISKKLFLINDMIAILLENNLEKEFVEKEIHNINNSLKRIKNIFMEYDLGV